MAILKNHSDLTALRKAGHIVNTVLAELQTACLPGTTTMALEKLAEHLLQRQRSSAPFKQFLNVNNQLFGYATCISINEEIVNGIPSENRMLQEGDVVSIATATEYRGLHAKAARTVFVGEAPPENIKRLLNGTEAVLQNVIACSKDATTLNALLQCIPDTAKAFGLTVLEEMGGQEIGKKLHGHLPTPNYPEVLQEVIPLQVGQCFTVMPMLSLGHNPAIKVHQNGWTYCTQDDQISAHIAETLLMTTAGLCVITQ